MKIVLITFVSNKESWFQEVKELYTKKINQMFSFELIEIKAPKGEREQAEQKKKQEAELLLKSLKPDDYVVLMDERGKPLSSLSFSRWFENEAMISPSSKRIVFIIGGAYGVSDEIQNRARLKLQMGPWTLNHLVAQTVLLEQLYRALTIIKGLPYHNG